MPNTPRNPVALRGPGHTSPHHRDICPHFNENLTVSSTPVDDPSFGTYVPLQQDHDRDMCPSPRFPGFPASTRPLQLRPTRPPSPLDALPLPRPPPHLLAGSPTKRLVEDSNARPRPDSTSASDTHPPERRRCPVPHRADADGCRPLRPDGTYVPKRGTPVPGFRALRNWQRLFGLETPRKPRSQT